MMIQSKKKKVHQRVHHYTLSTTQIDISKKGGLTVECDEMWSFVGLKHNKQWIWLALDSDSREIVGMHVGSRDFPLFYPLYLLRYNFIRAHPVALVSGYQLPVAGSVK